MSAAAEALAALDQAAQRRYEEEVDERQRKYAVDKDALLRAFRSELALLPHLHAVDKEIEKRRLVALLAAEDGPEGDE